MKDNKQVTQLNSAKESCLRDTSGGAQRARLLSRLKRGPMDTFTAIRELNICRPGARIAELRAAGFPIHTKLVTLTDDHGRTHKRVALYYLTNTITKS